MEGMNVIRRFEQNDWYAYAGAEKFSDGSEPFIYVTALDDGEAEIIVVADKNGVMIEIYAEEYATSELPACVWQKNIPLRSPLLALGELRNAISFIAGFSDAADVAFTLYNGFDETMKGYEFID